MSDPLDDPLGLQGQTLAQKYRIEELVDVGGFSIVYKAHHTVWKKPVAVKLFNALSLAKSAQRESLQEAFLREGALLAELSSKTTSIVQAWDVGTYTTPSGEWMPYMVLEWLDGKPLDRIVDEELERGDGPWSFGEVYELLAEAAKALDLAHRQGITHRDVKPGNLFVCGEPRSGKAVVKILDFGIAKVMSDGTLQADLATTGTGIKSFTPDYGAPEQFSRQYGATGPWTDVFALALVAVELVTGERPLGEGSLVELARASTDPGRRPTPATLGLPTPAAVEAVFARALAVQPADRFRTAGDFWRDLGAALGRGSARTLPEVSLGSIPDFEPSRESGRVQLSAATEITGRAPSLAPRRRILTALGAFTAVGALVGATIIWIGRQSRADEQPSVLAQGKLSVLGATAGEAAKNQCPSGMVEIPAGQFYMGSHEPSALPNEKPSFNVRLQAFCIDLTEVTVGAYRKCSDRGACPRPSRSVEWPNITEHQQRAYATACNDAYDDRLDHPVNCVSWSMAARYCEQNGKRLPREAEWEYATRGPDGRVYPWGDEAPTPAHLNACGTECVGWGEQNDEKLTALYDSSDGFPTTAPVGRFPKGRSRFGPFDVVGNVWEWVQDWYADYTPDEKESPAGPATGERRVIRGGGWNGSYATWLRPSFRYAQDPAALSPGIGFRCALDLPRELPDQRRAESTRPVQR